MNHATTGDNKAKSYDGDYMDVGKEGERIVMDWLRGRPNILGVTDFREIREIQEADVDVGVRLYTGQICLAEIKTDTYLGVSGNILNELLRINHRAEPKFAGYLGWTLRSPAEWLLYYAPNRNPPAIYQGRFFDIRRVVQEYTKKHDVKFTTIRTDTNKTTYAILIPEEEYGGVFKIHETK